MILGVNVALTRNDYEGARLLRIRQAHCYGLYQFSSYLPTNYRVDTFLPPDKVPRWRCFLYTRTYLPLIKPTIDYYYSLLDSIHPSRSFKLQL